MSEREEMNAKVQELINCIKGLSLEVEGWRTSSDSTSYFILEVLKDLTIACLAIQVKLNDYR